MPDKWEQTINTDERIACSLIEKQQHMKVHSIRLLDEGWDNVVFLVNKNYIFRFPRRQFGVLCMENEISLLPYIAKRVSFPLSCPQWTGAPSALYPYPYSGYRRLPGKPLCDATPHLVESIHFAVMLAEWLRELHDLNVTEDGSSLIKGNHDWRLDTDQRPNHCFESLSHYESYFLEAGFKKNDLIDLIEKLRHFKFKKHTNALISG